MMKVNLSMRSLTTSKPTCNCQTDTPLSNCWRCVDSRTGLNTYGVRPFAKAEAIMARVLFPNG